MTSPIRLQLQQWLVIADTIPFSNTIPLNHRQVVGKAIALPYIGRHCLPYDKHQFSSLGVLQNATRPRIIEFLFSCGG
jgi:hypothetical protein